jgi:hypothetical protein
VRLAEHHQMIETFAPSLNALARVMNRYFISRQFSINVAVTYVWHEYRRARPFPGRLWEGEMRKIAIVALMVMTGMSTPVQFGVSYAQPAPEAAATSAMADKAAAMKTLADAKKRFKFMRTKSSQDPHAQADLDRQIKQINGVMAKLKKGEDVPQSDVDAAVATPPGLH